MLTIPFIRANSEITIQGLRKKHVANASEIVNQLIAMDDQRKAYCNKLNQLWKYRMWRQKK